MKTVKIDDIPFFHSTRDRNPLDAIPEFDRGDYWSIDASCHISDDEELSDYYRMDPDSEDECVLIPKKEVIKVWFVSYKEGGGAPRAIRRGRI